MLNAEVSWDPLENSEFGLQEGLPCVDWLN